MLVLALCVTAAEDLDERRVKRRCPAHFRLLHCWQHPGIQTAECFLTLQLLALMCRHRWKQGRTTYYGELLWGPAHARAIADTHRACDAPCKPLVPGTHVQDMLSQSGHHVLMISVCFLCMHAGTDDWSIHKGSCGYGALWKDEPHG